MSENKNDAPKKEASKERQTLKNWFLDIRGEYKKIIWPGRDELIKKTITVVATSAIFGVLIVAMDGVFAQAYRMFINAVASL